MKKKRFLIHFIMAVLVFVMVFESAIWYYRSFRKSLYEELFFHLRETTAQITKTIDTTMDAEWTRLDMLAFYVEHHRDQTRQEVLDEMQKILEEQGEKQLLFALMDENGKYFFSNGMKVKSLWRDVSYQDSEERQTFIRQDNLIENKEHMIFLRKFKEPVTLKDGSVITHVAANREMQFYNEASRSDAYSGQNVVFILNSVGGKVYQDTGLDSFLNAQNVLKALESTKIVQGDSFEKMKKNVETHVCSVAAAEHEGEEYFLAFQPMTHNGWNMLMVVPKEYVSAQTSDFVRYILGTTSVMIALVLLIVFGVVIAGIRTQNRARLYRQTKASNEALYEALEEARRANQAKSQFLSHMSHDVRTPINGIIGMLSVAERNLDSRETVADCLGKIRTASRHLLSLVNDILDISKLESGKMEFHRETFLLEPLLDGCCSIIQGQLVGKEITFRRDFSEIRHGCIVGSELHLRQILINILGNAVKYTNEGSISFSVRETDFHGDGKADFAFVIADTGIGMAKDFLKEIFEPFVQEDGGARTTYKGTGLGMAIVKKTVDQMGGSISVESEPGVGSTFTVRLSFPVGEMHAVEDLSVKEAGKIDVKGMKVLLVEDNELNREIAKLFLEEAGALVEIAENGKEALDKFTASAPGTYEIILMDVMMPVMDGLEASRKIRASAHPQAKTIPIIAQTANAFAEDVTAAKEAGMNEHVAKPLDENQLLHLMTRYRKRG